MNLRINKTRRRKGKGVRIKTLCLCVCILIENVKVKEESSLTIYHFLLFAETHHAKASSGD